MSENQRTIRKEVRFEGQGIHSGRSVRMVLKPAPVGTGIVFLRTDIPNCRKTRAVIENVYRDQGRQTAVGTKEWKIQTIEHLMSALHGLRVDNLQVEVAGDEIPGLDGSSKIYADEILKAGFEEQNTPREYMNLTTPFYCQDKDVFITIIPADELIVSYTLSYRHPDLSDQFYSAVVTPERYAAEIAPARTFCLKEEAEALRKLGYGKGADLTNTLVFEKNQPIKNTLRFENEACRHKVADLLGDLYLTGQFFKGHVIAGRSGHNLNLELAKLLADFRTPAYRLREEGVVLKVPCGPSDTEGIKKVLPHRFPFLFVDQILEMEPGKKIVGLKKVKKTEFFFQGHFPGHAVMPGVLMIEALAQCGGYLMLSKPENDGKLAYFMTIEKAKFRQPVMPGDELRFEAEVIRDRSRTGECAGRAYVGDKLVCEAEVRFAVVDTNRPSAPEKTDPSQVGSSGETSK